MHPSVRYQWLENIGFGLSEYMIYYVGHTHSHKEIFCASVFIYHGLCNRDTFQTIMKLITFSE